MDQKSEVKNVDYMTMITTNNYKALIKRGNIDDHCDHGLPKSKRKRRPTRFMHAIKVAMYALGRRSGKSKAMQLDAASKLTNLISSVRPLHVEGNNNNNNNDEKNNNINVQHYTPRNEALPREDAVEVNSEPMSPAHTCYSSSDAGMTSAYASAANLLDLDPTWKEDENDEEEDEDSYFDDKCGDDMIDAKAEQFIAHFYHHMKVQHDAYSVQYNKWINRKSIN